MSREELLVEATQGRKKTYYQTVVRDISIGTRLNETIGIKTILAKASNLGRSIRS